MTVSSGPVRARPATSADAELASELVALCHTAMLAQRDGELWNSLDKNSLAVTARLQQRINGSIVIIGEIKEVPVGVAVLDLRRPSDHIGDAPIAVIEEIYTMPDARGVGVGSAMITTAVEWCHTVGARGIEAIALPGDRNTKNFFEAHRLTARSIRVHRTL